MCAPNLFRITLDTNPEDCNLHCVMCEEHSPYSRFKQELFRTTGVRRRLMPRHLIERLFEQAAALGVQEVIPSTMGEPLLYEHIDLIYDLAERYGIKINLTTNGTFPRRSLEQWATLIIPRTSDIKISWNGASAATYAQVMRGGNFDKALRLLKRFIALRDEYYAGTGYYCRVTLQLTFMAHTMHELPEIVRLAGGLGVDRIKGHHLWAHFEEIKPYAIPANVGYWQEWNNYVAACYEIVSALQKRGGKALILENIYPLAKGEGKEQVTEEYICPFLGRELWISASGEISPCCAPDKLRRTLGDFGSIYRTSLKEVLMSPQYLHLREHYQEQLLCKTCNMRRPL